ncbi:OLC1v1009409C1 [Oldenlandia corymbosa var. corymbosa]|uniref:OLC1v1009409C1 n=1 Tax=Oldenlandia corymbosa var. corymbosa TaxID=529605 RepID=A0AAV1DNV4_OLDCO|nr:OLC1v1009409C1 [Oldenlandia corymbosa var. corymbosa]
MGLFTYSIAGGGFILIGAWESLVASSESPNLDPASRPPANQNQPKSGLLPSSSVTFASISALSFLFVLNTLVSLFDALSSKDQVGFAFQLEVLAIGLLFLVYSILGLLTHIRGSFRLPAALLNLLFLFAFGQEFVFFYVRRKDPDGIENRYYDLFLVPIGICIFCTMLELKNSRSSYARLGRGVGLISQGLWIVQMGFSFFSDMMVRGCFLQGKSRGNYTIKCKGHPEYHRGRAIATLQFNCHLAFLATLLVVVYGIICRKRGIRPDHLRYRPLGAEMSHLDGQTQFTLDSDDDENGIEEVRSVEMQKAIVSVPASEVNGYGTH